MRDRQAVPQFSPFVALSTDQAAHPISEAAPPYCSPPKRERHEGVVLPAVGGQAWVAVEVAVGVVGVPDDGLFVYVHELAQGEAQSGC